MGRSQNPVKRLLCIVVGVVIVVVAAARPKGGNPARAYVRLLQLLRPPVRPRLPLDTLYRILKKLAGAGFLRPEVFCQQFHEVPTSDYPDGLLGAPSESS